MPVTGIVFDDPVLTAALVLVIAGVLWYQRGLSWGQYRTIHRFKVRTFPILQRVTPASVSFVNEKGYRDDAEYLTTRAHGVAAVVAQLRDGGASPHLVCSIKRRATPAGVAGQYSAAHLLWMHDDGTQTEAYLFANGDGSTDVYAHHEVATTNPEAHLDGPQTDGDPRGVVRAALDGDSYVENAGGDAVDV